MLIKKFSLIPASLQFASVYDEPPVDPPADDKKTPPKNKTFSQEEVDTILENERQRANQQKQDYIDQLTALKDKTGLTEQEKETLEQQIAGLKKEVVSKEELAKKKQEKLTKDFQDQLTNLTHQAKSWQSRYESEKIQTELMSRATEAGAFNPQQIVGLLGNKTKVVPILSDEGQETGNYKVVVEQSVDGKDLQLSVDEAIGQLKADIETNGNLFKSNLKGGVGSFTREDLADMNNVRSIANMTPEQYRKHRNSIKKGSN